jgi:mannose-6-phosphate isomerase-like protein (cupin superfamily)
MNTTDFVKAKKHQFFTQPCHGVKGAWHFKDYIDSLSKDKSIVKFIHDDILPPGSSFGIHEHKFHDDELFEEWYLCLAGHGIMTLDGVQHPFGEGDITVCRSGGSHGVENTGDSDMRLIVICAQAK